MYAYVDVVLEILLDGFGYKAQLQSNHKLINKSYNKLSTVSNVKETVLGIF